MKKLNKKGVAGLNIFLGVIVMLFMIGLIVMVFTIAGNKLSDNVGYDTSGSVTQGDLDCTGGGTLTACAAASGAKNVVASSVINASDGTAVGSGNYTISGCVIANATSTFAGNTWNVTYTYDYWSNVGDIVNETTDAIAGSTDWFGTFIVLAALVVLILMVVLIVTSIRGTSYVGGGEGGLFKPPRESA